MVAKPRKPVRKKPATKSGRKKPARKLVSKKGNRKPVRKRSRNEPFGKLVSKKASRKPPPQKRVRAADRGEPKGNQIEPTTNDWPEKIELSAEFRRTKAALWRRWRTLGNSEEFVWETFKLKWKLGQAFEANPDLVRDFFRPTFRVTLIESQRLLSRIDAVEDEGFRSLLRRYLKYATQYGVVFQLFPKTPCFRVREGQGVLENRLQVVIRGRQQVVDGPPRVVIRTASFEPRGGPRPADAFGEGFESDVIATPPELERLVRDGLAKYVVIDDEEPFSLLRQMIYLAYSPNQVTVFRYNSVPSYTLFLVGQNASLPDAWDKLRTVAVADQRAAGTRDKRGVPTDVLKLYARLNTIMRGKGSQIERATRFVPADDPKADPKAGKQAREYAKRLAIMESVLSQLKRRLEE